MKKITQFILFSGLLLTACTKNDITPGAPPEEIAVTANIGGTNSGSEIIKNVPVSDVFFNECCNEEIFVSGTARFVINKNIIHIEVSDITGTGLTTGFDYSSSTPSVQTNIFYSNPNEGILTFMLSMTNDEGCGFRLKFTFRLNVNANGETVVDFQNVVSACQ